MKKQTIGSILSEIESENEKRSWEIKTAIRYRVNAVVNGYGLSRTINAANDQNPHGITEDQVRAMVKKLQSKGFETTLAKTTETIERLI